MSVSHEDPWLSFNDAMEYMRTSRTTLNRRVAEHDIRFTRNGKNGNYLFRKSWIDEYLAENEQAARKSKSRRRTRVAA